MFRSRGTVQVFEQQTALQSITGFARLFKQVAQVKNSSIQKFVRTRVIGVFDIHPPVERLAFFFFVNFSPALYYLNAWNRLQKDQKRL